MKKSIYWLSIILFIGCQGEEGAIGPAGENGLNSLVKISNEAPGINCENGGLKSEIGVDNNSNGILDSNEIQNTSYVCNGINGNNSLTSVISEPSGANCENGGVKINSGIDSNSDGILNDSEIFSTSYICNGIDGNNSLIKTTNEPSGTNCENGGLKIDFGIDSNSNGILDDSEVSTTSYICNGIGDNNSLIKTTNEPSGTNCENGGLKIDFGVDNDQNGILDDIEVTTTKYLCNGVEGNNSITRIVNEPNGSFCSSGGIKVESGVDNNSNSELDQNEITSSEYICNGIDGLSVKETRLLIYHGATGGSYSGISSTSRFKLGQLIRFDKRDWTSASSIKFNAVARTTSISNNLILELYNDTDNILIQGSTVTSNNLSFDTIESENVINSLPEKEITLSLYIRSENDGVSVNFNSKSELIIEQ